MFSVYSFEDPIDALNSYFSLKKQSQPSFSLRSWSKKMGLNSPKLLADLLHRKTKIKPKHSDFLLNGLTIDQSEHMYFRSLIQFVNARDSNEKQLLLLLLKELGQHKANAVVRSDSEKIFSHWIYMVILTLASVRHFSLSTESVFSILKPQTSKKQIEEAIDTLLQEGLLKLENSKLVSAQKRVTTKTEISMEAVKNYYRQVFLMASAAVETDPLEREFQCFSVRLKQEDLPVVKQMIRQLREKISSLSSSDADFVHQVNLCSFPVTKPLK